MRKETKCLGAAILIVIVVTVITYCTAGRNRIVPREIAIRRNNGAEIVTVVDRDLKSGINASFCDVIKQNKNISVIPGYNTMPDQQKSTNSMKALQEALR